MSDELCLVTELREQGQVIGRTVLGSDAGPGFPSQRLPIPPGADELRIYVADLETGEPIRSAPALT